MTRLDFNMIESCVEDHFLMQKHAAAYLDAFALTFSLGRLFNSCFARSQTRSI